MYKKRLLILLILLLILFPIYSQMMLQPVASVNLIRPQMITREELDAFKAEQQMNNNNQTISDIDALDTLINNFLVLQGAERAGIALSENNLNTLVAEQKKSVEAQIGRVISDMDFSSLLLQAYNMTQEDLRIELKQNYMVSTYIRTAKTELISNIPGPTNDEINTYYRKNAASFINPEYIHVSHIFINKNNQIDVDPKEMAESVLTQWEFGQKSYDSMVMEFSQDETSKFIGGDIGWFSISDERNRLIFGDNFIDSIFSIENGVASRVIESNIGYHIVKILEHKQPKLLSLDEQVDPENSMTVKQYISQTLYYEKQQAAYLLAVDEIIKDLRAEAEITILL
jgi:peptidyl-prolyl cis-trans isomerase SurA